MDGKELLERIERGEILVYASENGKSTTAKEDQKIINELLRLAKLGADRQWIPVSERLPGYGQNVLANRIFAHGITGYQLLRFGKYQNTPCWFHQESVFSVKLVTHWMPLPEPPKEGE